MYFIKPTREYPSQSGTTKDVERRLVNVSFGFHRGQMLKGFNSGRPRANFPHKILKEKHCNNLNSNLRKETKVGKRRSLDFSNTKFGIFPAFC